MSLILSLGDYHMWLNELIDKKDANVFSVKKKVTVR
jgi:hypothetical protein